MVSPSRQFVHLHNHTEFSKQDSIARVSALAAAVAKHGQPAAAMTDHGNTAAALRFVKACDKAGVKPILGCEVYMALVPDGSDPDAPTLPWNDPKVRFARTTQTGVDAESGKTKKVLNNHLTILVKNETGWRNLCRITNKAEESFYHKPLIDYALLKEHSEGLIVLTGCLGGPVASNVARHRSLLAEADRLDLTRSGERDPVVLRQTEEGLLAVLAEMGADATEEDVAAFNAQLDAVRVQLGRVEEFINHLGDEEAEIRKAALNAEAEAATVQARENLERLFECVGKENVYVEIMEHGLDAEGVDHIKSLIALARETGMTYVDSDGETRLQVVATNDCHYVEPDAADAHDSWLVNGELARGNAKTKKDDPDRWRFNGAGYWLRSTDEMYDLHPNAPSWREACAETVRLSERVDESVIPFKKLRLPKFPVPYDVVAEWEAGAEATVTDKSDNVHTARVVGTRAYRTPSALYLHRLVLQGMAADDRTPGERSPEQRERLGFEFGVITTDLGLEDYFLIVYDVLDWARSDRGMPTAEFPRGEPGKKKPILVGPGRGSAAGSIISYALRIVMVDPLRWGLLFERFLDIDRIGMPDIDVDFESARRSEVYDYLAHRYDVVHPDGTRDRYVARIGAFQVAKTKRAIKDAARVLEVTALGDALNKLVPVHQGSPQSFAEIFEEVRDKDSGEFIQNPEASEFRELAGRDDAAVELVALARAFENVVAGEGIHAAGVIISDEPLDDLIPMRAERKKGVIVSDVPVALWDGNDIDSFGMLKLDALSIDNLDYLAAAREHIERIHGVDLDPDRLPDPDDHSNPSVEAAYDLLRAGGTEGIFQMESPGLTELTVSAAPTKFEDISALLALYRPGPMGENMHTLFADRKNGRAPVDYDMFTKDPAEVAVIASVLGDTQAVIVYQESLMELSAKVAGFDALQRSDLRKAVSKKVRSEIDRLRDIFMEQGAREMVLPDGTVKIAFQESTLINLWATFNASAKYLFNKSHTVAYGYLSYITAYFKANYPIEYGAAILGVSKKKPEKRFAAIGYLHKSGVEIMPPDVNLSLADTAPDDSGASIVRLGLSEVRDVGQNGHWIAQERLANGPYVSLTDLVERAKVPDKEGELTAKLGALALEGLVEAGAFDSFGQSRLGLMVALRALSVTPDVVIPNDEWSPLELSIRQRARLGVALGAHPLDSYAETVHGFLFGKGESDAGSRTGIYTVPVHLVADGARDVTIHGVLTAWSEMTTRKGTKMVKFTIESQTGAMTGTMFDGTLTSIKKAGHLPEIGELVAVDGYMKSREYIATITNEDGEEVEEVRHVRELIANGLEVILVDRSIQKTAAQVEAPSLRLADVIHLARERRDGMPLPSKATARTKGSVVSADPTLFAMEVPEDVVVGSSPHSGSWDDVLLGVPKEVRAHWKLTPRPEQQGDFRSHRLLLAKAKGFPASLFDKVKSQADGRGAAVMRVVPSGETLLIVFSNEPDIVKRRSEFSPSSAAWETVDGHPEWRYASLDALLERAVDLRVA